MARIHIERPEHFAFSSDIALYRSHMNYGKHLNNALLLTVVLEARREQCAQRRKTPGHLCVRRLQLAAV